MFYCVCQGLNHIVLIQCQIQLQPILSRKSTNDSDATMQILKWIMEKIVWNAYSQSPPPPPHTHTHTLTLNDTMSGLLVSGYSSLMSFCSLWRRSVNVQWHPPTLTETIGDAHWALIETTIITIKAYPLTIPLITKTEVTRWCVCIHTLQKTNHFYFIN